MADLIDVMTPALDVEGRVAGLLGDGEPAVLLTVVHAEGAAPRAAGSHALLTMQGQEGSVGGGAPEAMAMETARDALYGGYSRIVGCGLDGGEEGSGGGTVRILCEFLEPERAGMFQAAARALEEEMEAIWMLDLRDPDSPRRMLCLEALPPGFGGDDADAPEPPLEMDGGEPAPAPAGPPDGVALNHAAAAARLARNGGRAGLLADGTPLYLEPLSARPILLLCGGGHVARETAALAHAAGFIVDVADDRAEFADARRFPMARHAYVLPDFENLAQRCGIGHRHHVVIVTRDPGLDAEALSQALRSPACYIGMIGGREKRRAVFSALREQGIPAMELGVVRCPIGIPVNAQTPQEYAVGIVAELLASRAGTLQRLRVDDDAAAFR